LSINNTVIHFCNIADFPVVCFDNGEFEGYNTSLGKIERVGNHVTGTFAAALLRWLVRDADGSGDARRQAIAESVTDPSIAQILQHLCDTVRPHLEYIVAYFNALAQSPQLTRATWGEHLPLLGLFRDPAFLQTPSASARALTENHTLSQVSYWQRETNERIRNASLGKRAQALLLGVLADSSRLPQAKRELNLGDIRPLVTRSRRSAEQIAQTQIRADLQLVHFNWQAEESEGGTIDDLILGIFEYFRSRAQPSLVVPPPAEGSRSEELQKAIGYLRPKTITAIQKALAQQTPLLATNIFLGILRCLLAWKEEQEAKTGQGTTTLRGIGLFPQARIEKLSVLGVQLLPNPTKEKWATLVSKVDRQIREQWGELLRDTVLDLLMEHDQPTGIAAHTNAQAHGVSPATSKIKRSPRAASAMRTGG